MSEERYRYVGAVQFGHYPYEQGGYGIETEEGKKVALATSDEYGCLIAAALNARAREQELEAQLFELQREHAAMCLASVDEGIYVAALKREQDLRAACVFVDNGYKTCRLCGRQEEPDDAPPFTTRIRHKRECALASTSAEPEEVQG